MIKLFHEVLRTRGQKSLYKLYVFMRTVGFMNRVNCYEARFFLTLQGFCSKILIRPSQFDSVERA